MMRVLSLANEEPLVGMQSGVDVMQKVIRKNSRNGSDCVIGEGEAALCCGRQWGVGKGLFCAQDGDIGCDGGIGVHRWSEVFLVGGGDKNIVGVYSDIFVEQGEEKGVEEFLRNMRQGGRHRHGGLSCSCSCFL